MQEKIQGKELFEPDITFINKGMEKKKYIGQMIAVKYSDRPTPFYGFVVDHNDDWTLMKLNPSDYYIDGYVILRHKNIEGLKGMLL